MLRFLITFFLALGGLMHAQAVMKLQMYDEAGQAGFLRGKIIAANQKSETFEGMVVHQDTSGLPFPWTVEVWGYFPQRIDAYSDQPLKLFWIPKTHLIPEYTVAETVFPTSREKLGREVEIVNDKQIQRRNSQTPAHALEESGHVFVQRSQMGGGSPIIRGFEASRILLVVDGVRMNNAIFRTGHLQNILRVDVNALQQMEVLFGPGTVKHGSDAMGGAILLQTIKPEFTPTPSLNGQFFTRFASANFEKTTHGHFQYGNAKWAGATSFTLADYGDLRQGNRRSPLLPDFGKQFFYVERVKDKDSVFVNSDPNVQKGTAYRQFDLVQRAALKTGDLRHDLNFQYSLTSNVPRYDRLTETNSSNVPLYAQWYYGPEERMMVAYSLSNEESTTIKYRLLAAWQQVKESRHSRRLNNNNLRNQEESVQVFELRWDLMSPAQNKKVTNILPYRWRAGADVQMNLVNSKGTYKDIVTEAISPGPTRYPDGGSHQLLAGIYGEIAQPISRKSFIAISGRLNISQLYAKFQDSVFFNFPFQTAEYFNFGGNGAVEWVTKFSNRSILKHISLVASSGFRAPNVDDIGKVFDSNPSMLVVPNPNIKPEYVYTFEARSRWGTEMHQVQIGGYFSWVSGLLALRPSQWNGQDSLLFDGIQSQVMSLKNVDNGWILGANIRYFGQLSRHFSAFARLTYTYGRQRHEGQDIPLEHIPPLFGTAGINFYTGKFSAEGWIRFAGWKYAEDYGLFGEDNIQYATPQGMPGWHTFNLGLQWSPLPAVHLQLNVENLLDANYRNFGSGISAPGRNFILCLRGNF